MHDDLTMFAIRNGTDKFGYHDYTPNYHSLFARFRNRPIRLLEIGVGGYGQVHRGGESLATWRDYFPLARIVGLDIQKKILDFGPRVRIVQGSQVDPGFLAQVVDEEGPFDLIIDDGSHQNEHVIESFGLLFPTLAPGGIYVVEDTQTAFVPRRGGSPDLKQPNSIGFFAQLLNRLLTGNDGPDIVTIPADGLSGIKRFHNMVALHKSAPDGAEAPVSWLAEPAKTARNGQKHVLTLNADDPAASQSEGLAGAFNTVASGGALVLHRGRIEDGLADFICRRFVEIDHIEQLVHFPDAPVHPMASELHAISVTDHKVALWRAPNLFPSNFAFNAANPQAAAALARMEEVLSDGKPWPGAIVLAELQMRFGQPEKVPALISRFGNGQGQPRDFFYLAARSLNLFGRKSEVRPLLETAVLEYPDEGPLVVQLVGLRFRDGEVAAAEALLSEAIARNPRGRHLHVRMAHLKLALGQLEESVKSVEIAMKLFPANGRAPMQLLLAQIRLRLNQTEAAETILLDLIDKNIPAVDRAFHLLSEVQHKIGQHAAALESINRAVELCPENLSHVRWREKVVP